MKKYALGVMIFVFLFLAQSCIKIEFNDHDSWSHKRITGKGPVVSEERLFSSFAAVSSQLGADVNIIESDEHYIVINAQENLVPVIKTSVRNGELRIFTSYESIQSDQPIIIDVYTPGVDKFSLEGAGNIVSHLPLNEIILSGAGNFYCKGAVENLKVSISGSGNLDLFEMPAQKAKVDIMGAGSVKVFVTEILDINIIGIGNVFYKGNPEVYQNIQGIGNIIESNK